MGDPKAAYIEWTAINNADFGCGMHNDLDVWYAAINFAGIESDKRIAELEAQLKANTLKKIMFEYEAAKEDASFDSEHPIFQMAAHIDSLEAQLKTAKRDGILEFSQGALSHEMAQAFLDHWTPAELKHGFYESTWIGIRAAIRIHANSLTGEEHGG